MRKIGITTTIPVEILFSADCVPVDLNNLLINSNEPMALIELAESEGWPRSLCSWVKGIYGAVISNSEIDAIVAVNQGDCSNTKALMETLQLKGIKVIDFAYPFDRNAESLKSQMEKLMRTVGGEWQNAIEWKRRLDRLRAKVWEIDKFTWMEPGTVTGFENHLCQVSCSDFCGDPDGFEEEVDALLKGVRGRGGAGPRGARPRLAFIGVPPIIPKIYDFIESLGAKVVFNETQRQFTMPFDTDDLVEQYRLFTYPYHISRRVKDIKDEIKRRRIDGVIHYVQSFCFRQIEDIVFREVLDRPLLTMEADLPGDIEGGVKMRVENFVEMLT